MINDPGTPLRWLRPGSTTTKPDRLQMWIERPVILRMNDYPRQGDWVDVPLVIAETVAEVMRKRSSGK